MSLKLAVLITSSNRLIKHSLLIYFRNMLIVNCYLPYNLLCVYIHILLLQFYPSCLSFNFCGIIVVYKPIVFEIIMLKIFCLLNDLQMNAK
jgi:hypothetical protein